MDEKTFTTRDLYSAAAISAVLDIPPEVTRNGDGRCYFSFPEDLRIRDIVKSFQQHSLEVNAFDYARALKDLKYSIHNQ